MHDSMHTRCLNSFYGQVFCKQPFQVCQPIVSVLEYNAQIRPFFRTARAMGLNNVFVLLVIRFLLLTLAVGHRLTVLRKFHHSSRLFKVTMID